MLSVKPKPTVRIENSPVYLSKIVRESPRSGMQIALKMTGILIFLIGAPLVFPRFANLNLDLPLFQQSINFLGQDAQARPKSETDGQQKLPDFGAPSSDRGSGTR